MKISGLSWLGSLHSFPLQVTKSLDENNQPFSHRFESDTSNWSSLNSFDWDVLKYVYNFNNVIRKISAKFNLKSAFLRTLIIFIWSTATLQYLFSVFMPVCDNTNNINHNSQQTHCQELFLLSWMVLNIGTFPPRLSCNNWENNRRSTRALFLSDFNGDKCVNSYLRICSGSSLSLNCEGKFKTGFTVKHWISAENWLRVENCSHSCHLAPKSIRTQYLFNLKHKH